MHICTKQREWSCWHCSRSAHTARGIWPSLWPKPTENKLLHLDMELRQIVKLTVTVFTMYTILILHCAAVEKQWLSPFLKAYFAVGFCFHLIGPNEEYYCSLRNREYDQFTRVIYVWGLRFDSIDGLRCLKESKLLLRLTHKAALAFRGSLEGERR